MSNEMYICKKVLVVDDTQIDRMVAERMIMKSGIAKEIVCLESATDALQYLEDARQSPETLPQLIFLDIKMPRMDGLEFLEVFSGLPEPIRSQCRIAMLTSSLDVNDEKQAMQYQPVCAFLRKPLTIEAMTVLDNMMF